MDETECNAHPARTANRIVLFTLVIAAVLMAVMLFVAFRKAPDIAARASLDVRVVLLERTKRHGAAAVAHWQPWISKALESRS